MDFAKRYQATTRGERALLLAQIAAVCLWIICLILGITVAVLYPDRAEMLWRGGRRLQDAPAYWGLFRAHIVTGIITSVLTVIHFGRHIVKFVKAGVKTEKETAK